MSGLYERKPEYWAEDLTDRAFEQAVMAALRGVGWRYDDHTEAFDRPDLVLYSRVRGRQVRSALELKDKRQPYRARWAELAGVAEADLLVLDELAARTLLAYAPRAFVLFWDRTRADHAYVLYTALDLLCMPKVRVQRPIALNSPRLKAKWLIDARHGHAFTDLNQALAAISVYLERGLANDLRRLEIHGPFVDEKVETL